MQMFEHQPPEDRQPVIVAACRTPIARAHGTLDRVDAAALVVPLIRQMLAEVPLPPETLSDVILGNAAGGGGNIARLAALSAGLPLAVPGLTVDRQCGSGLEAVILAARLVQAGAGESYLAGGVESVSTAPWRVEKPRRPGAMPRFFGRARFSPEAIGDPEMGIAAETVAREGGIPRARQDAFALQSHQRAVAAMQAGRFRQEIVPVDHPGGRLAEDECPRPDTSLAALAALKPAFVPDGTVTAGNACPLNDGASMLLVLSRARARALGLRQGLVFIDSAAAGVDPNRLGLGPVDSTRRLLARQPGLALDAVGRIEFNEAFAAQVLASLDRLAIAPERINRDGGALALGHPFGASGAILVTRLMAQLRQDGPDGALALAMLGIGGGLGLTALFRWEAAL